MPDIMEARLYHHRRIDHCRLPRVALGTESNAKLHSGNMTGAVTVCSLTCHDSDMPNYLICQLRTVWCISS
jgi:hypothetical protein